METLKFSFLKAEKLAYYEFSVFEGHVALAPLMKALNLQARRLVAADCVPPVCRAKLGATSVDALKVADLQDWLTKVGASNGVTRHFAEHFVPFIHGKSVDLQAQLALAKAEAKKKADAAPSVLCEPLNNTDHYRKDASTLGAARLPPAIIDQTAKAGSVDLFVRPAPTMWEPGKELPIQHMSLDIADGYHPNLLKDMKRAHREVLDGLQMVARYPDAPQVQRRTIPARQAVQSDGRHSFIVTVPAHLQLFPWERALMEATTDAQNIELPGSPYHQQRPLWLGL